MNLRHLIASNIILFGLIACGSNETEKETSSNETNHSEASEEMNENAIKDSTFIFDNVEWNKLKSGEVLPTDLQESNRAMVTFDGYVGDVTLGVDANKGSLRIHIYERRNKNEGFYMVAWIEEGTGMNQGILNEDGSEEAFIIMANDGEEIKSGDPVKITGILGVVGIRKSRTLHEVSKIEKREKSFDASILENAVELTDDVLNDKENEDEMTYAFMEGTIGNISPGSSLKSGYSVKFSQENNSHIDYVTLKKGEGPSTVQVPEIYIEGKPFTIFDIDGNKSKSNSKVKLYGTFMHGMGHGKGTFYVEEIELVK